MEITLALDSYDDIFDDFDMQAFIERAISADFVNVLINRIRKIGPDERINIILTMPKGERVKNTEDVIEKRLNSHFVNIAEYWEDKEKEISDFAVKILLIGLAFFIMGQIVIHQYVPFFDEYLIIPAWMFSFYGLDKLVDEKPKASKKRKFYEAISKAKLIFKDEDIYSK